MLKTRLRIIGLTLIIGLFVIAMSPFVAQAHSYHEIAGQFGVSFRWRHEPAMMGDVNAVIIDVVNLSTKQGIAGLEGTLRMHITEPDSTALDFPLQKSQEAGHTDGSYTTLDFVPPLNGNYKFTLIGTIDELAINEDIATEQVITFPSIAEQKAQLEAADRANLLNYVAVIGLGVVIVIVIAVFMLRSRAGTGETTSMPDSDDTLS